MRRWLVTREKQVDGAWEFYSYRCWVVDGVDMHAAAAAYVKAVEDSSREVDARYPGTVSDPWEEEGRPTEVGVAPMAEIGSFAIYSGPDNKHRARTFDNMWDFERVQSIAVPLAATMKRVHDTLGN